MVAEKLSKAFLLSDNSNSPPTTTHRAFVSFLKVLKSRPDLGACRLFRSQVVSRLFVDSVLPIADQIERLAPSLAAAQPSPEYPWRLLGADTVNAPREYAFAEFDPKNAQIAKTRLISQLLKIAYSARPLSPADVRKYCEANVPSRHGICPSDPASHVSTAGCRPSLPQVRAEHIRHEDHDPHLPRKEDAKEHDVVVDQVAAALKTAGHTRLDPRRPRRRERSSPAASQRRKPDLVFNLHGDVRQDHLGAVGVVGLLDLLGVPYTGGGPGEFYLQRGQGAHQEAAGLRAASTTPTSPSSPRTPTWRPAATCACRCSSSRCAWTPRSASTPKSLVRNATETDGARRRDPREGQRRGAGRGVHRGPRVLRRRAGQPRAAVAFPPIEMDFSGLPEGAPRVLDAKAKWDENSAEYKGTQGRAGRPAGRAAGPAAEGRARRLPRPARARLRPRRPAPDRDRRDLRDRGQRQLLPGARRASSPPPPPPRAWTTRRSSTASPSWPSNGRGSPLSPNAANEPSREASKARVARRSDSVWVGARLSFVGEEERF